MKILVVDDSRIMRNIIKNTLTASKKWHFVDYIEAGDGEEAFELLLKGGVDLLLLDWNMPKLNGIDLVRKLREDLRFHKLPIVMITSEAAKYSVIEAVKAGVNDYLIKPVSERSLLDKLERIGV
ncbi:MAG: histidine kinase [Spirochaetes bacterium GWB1_48_6]|nr:MAG: histidine kinase [Spirochaetes bacterium GWB1_48_6]